MTNVLFHKRFSASDVNACVTECDQFIEWLRRFVRQVVLRHAFRLVEILELHALRAANLDGANDDAKPFARLRGARFPAEGGTLKVAANDGIVDQLAYGRGVDGRFRHGVGASRRS